jgi:hypothetical protein
MNEKTKLNEAKYFYQRMLKECNDRRSFTYDLSAFLNAARSVLQYGRKEVRNKTGGLCWYDNYVAKKTVLSFFREKRNLNIHDEPVLPNQNIIANATLTARASISVVMKDANGNIQRSIETPETEVKLPPAQEPIGIRIRYFFSDWKGSEDIVTLCEKYIGELEDFVQDGIKQGFLLGQ